MATQYSYKSLSFNYFETIKGVLDVAVDTITEEQGMTVNEVRSKMKQHVKRISDEYFSGKKPNIPFDDPICRLAYLYCYVAANANLCEIALRQPDLSDFILERFKNKEELNVCAFGGGPGTELLALAKFLIAKSSKIPKSTVFFTLLDEVEEWAETWSLIDKQVRLFLNENFGKTSTWPFHISRSFVPFDITKTQSYGSIKHLLGQDLYILSYVVSELLEKPQIAGLKSLLKSMVSCAKPGSKVLVIDRRQSSIVSDTNALFGTLGLEVSEFEESKTNMDLDEQVVDLGDHLLSDWLPKVTWNSFWLIGTKV